MGDLVLVDRVTHLWINHLGDVSPQRPEYLRRLQHLGERNVGILVAASEEDGSSLERSFGLPLRPLGPP